jgi:hypothetical protein
VAIAGADTYNSATLGTDASKEVRPMNHELKQVYQEISRRIIHLRDSL